MRIRINRVTRTCLIAPWLVLSATRLVAADCITPSADVVTAAVLRAQPSTASARLGILKPGQSLPFVGSQASWYATQRTDGTAAFASKRWTKIVSCETSGIIASEPGAGPAPATDATNPTQPGSPVPLLAKGHAVDWWFVFKFNAVKFPGCGGGQLHPLSCPFGGTSKTYSTGQQFVFASSESAELTAGTDCLGATEQDPVGATYDEIYNGRWHYVVWNDQFNGDPRVSGCGDDCNSPWGHSKGLVAWDDAGNGTVIQVTTPSWPGSGNQEFPRHSDGNTLGCVIDDDVKYSQHFFAAKLTRDDLLTVLRALQNASVATDPSQAQIVNSGGPDDIQGVVGELGHRSSSTHATLDTLSNGIRLISKPSALHVPPWQLVSSLLGSVALRAATWWTTPAIDSTSANSTVQCWDDSLALPGAVEIATSGVWNGISFGLKGVAANGNHAKIGVSTDADSGLAIFGDMNQQGTLTGTTTPDGTCKSSQNGRGGIFFIVKNPELARSVGSLIGGDTDPTH